MIIKFRSLFLLLLLALLHESMEQTRSKYNIVVPFYYHIVLRLGSLIYLDGFGMVPDYSQLSAASITSSTGLWCRGGIEATDAVQWILPDATILSSGNTCSNITTVSVCLQSVGLFAISGHNVNNEESLVSTGGSSLLLSGVYTCIVPFKDGRIEKYYVWIVKGKHYSEQSIAYLYYCDREYTSSFWSHIKWLHYHWYQSIPVHANTKCWRSSKQWSSD